MLSYTSYTSYTRKYKITCRHAPLGWWRQVIVYIETFLNLLGFQAIQGNDIYAVGTPVGIFPNTDYDHHK